MYFAENLPETFRKIPRSYVDSCAGEIREGPRAAGPRSGREIWWKFVNFKKESPDLVFDVPIQMTAVDYIKDDLFELVYYLYSSKKNTRSF